MTKRRKLIFYGILVVFVCLVTGVLVEFIARQVYTDSTFTIHNDAAVFQHDSVLGWKGVPNYRGVPRPEYGAEVSINSYGFRDSDWGEKLDLAARMGQTKVLFLGDSTLYGARINAKDRITEQFGFVYRNQGEEISIFNAGIPGFGTDQEYRALLTLLPIINPDIVVLRFTTNDIGDAALPYNQRHSKRVYKPFYNYDGDLVLNEYVPKRFSYSVRDTYFARFRSKFLVDAVQKIFDEIKYREFNLPEPVFFQARQPVQRRWFQYDNTFGFDAMFNLHQYRELYEQNSKRNISLLRKMQQICRQKGIQFIMLVDMSVGDDATYAERDFMSRLANDNIEAVNIHRILNEYRPWSYVNYDGHPNFLKNYIGASAIYNRIRQTDLDIDLTASDWYKDVPMTIDFSQDNFDRFLFGHWHRTERTDPAGFRWMGDSGYLMLRKPQTGEPVQITIEGMSRFAGKNTSLYMFGEPPQNVITLLDRGKVIGQAAVPDQGPFRIQFEHEAQQELLWLNIVSSRSFRPYISGLSKDERQLSVLISKIAVAAE